MESGESRWFQNPDPAESQDVKTEDCTSSDGGRSNSEGNQNPEDPLNEEEEEIQKIIIKEEEEEEDDEDYLYGGMPSSVSLIVHVDQIQEKSVKGEEADNEDYLYCELCKSFFINKCELHGPALFIPDSPVPMGVPDRVRKTLPPGLEVQKSGIPDAGLGVFNKGQTVPVGAHFGPYQGDVVEREEAMNSGYSWVIYRSRKCEEYIDAKREMNANWMRYVNCARTDQEQNLVAFQYGGGILYRSCRPIELGQELLVWYDEEYAKDLSVTFHYIWNKKSSANDMNNFRLEVYHCLLCPLSYKSQSDLYKHITRCHIRTCYVRLVKLRESQRENVTPLRDFSRLETSNSSLCHNVYCEQIQKCMHHCSGCGTCMTQQGVVETDKCVKEEQTYDCPQCAKGLRQGDSQQCLSFYLAEKPYQCSQCGKMFTRQRSLQEHKHIHTGTKPYQCSQCGKCFTRQATLRQHRHIHTGRKPYQCSQCGKSFTRPSGLQEHQRIHSGTKPYQCSQCGKNFTRQGHLQQHQRVHTGQKPYRCSQCSKNFIHKVSLRLHQRIHTGEKLHECSQCGKNFIQHRSLRLHQHVHTGEKPYQCLQCGKSFAQRSTLQQHQRVHTGEKPYRCSHCGKSFAQRSTLQQHRRVHTGERPFQCARCGKSFAQQSNLRHHERLHTGQKQLQTAV